jgi:exodeoxyribonuclease-3
MKIVSYNINGIRAAIKKDFLKWLEGEDIDILCLQELKAMPEQFETSDFEKLGYHCLWNSAEKKGYSGVALLSKQKPKHVSFGIGKDEFDREGRAIIAEFDDFLQISTYIPSGSSGRQDFKMAYLDYFYHFVEEYLKKQPNLIISGDVNICHQAIDIHDPVRNAKVSGFLPEEREWVSEFLDLGFIDSFRYMHEFEVKYSWWTYRMRARERNLGWRIDYNMVSQAMKNRIKKAEIWNDVYHSDHCPVMVEV